MTHFCRHEDVLDAPALNRNIIADVRGREVERKVGTVVLDNELLVSNAICRGAANTLFLLARIRYVVIYLGIFFLSSQFQAVSARPSS
jgi:hypothetical protein